LSRNNFRGNWSHPQSRILLLLFTPYILQFLHRNLCFCWSFSSTWFCTVFAFAHLNASANHKRMFRRCPALACSGTEVNYRGIIGEFNRWYLTRQLLQMLLSSALKCVFSYSSKTNRLMNYAFSFFKKNVFNICTQLSLPSRPVQGYSTIIPLFPFFLLYHLSADSVYNLLNVSQQTLLLPMQNINSIKIYCKCKHCTFIPGKCYCSPLGSSKLRFIGWRNHHVDNCFSEVRKLWISFEAENSRFIFAWINSIQMN